MKKNLQLALAIMLGLATTVSAQDWSVDSRTRVTNNDTEMSTDQRVRLGMSFGTDAVSVHTSFNTTAELGKLAQGTDGNFDFDVREAYASTDLMGYATLSAGRMALNLGSGRVIGDNNWTNEKGNTWDGFMFAINNDFADVHFGYASANDTALNLDGAGMIVNIGKDMGDMSFNATYYDASEEGSGMEQTIMALEGAYAMSNGVNLTLGYYTQDLTSATGATVEESGLTALGASYGVNDNMSVHVGYDMYDDNGFYSDMGSFGGADFQFGNALNYADLDGCTDMSFGGTYNMGNMSFGATMHNVTRDEDAAASVTARDFSTMEFNLGYTLNDNASFSFNYASNDEAGDDGNQMWMGLHVAF